MSLFGILRRRYGRSAVHVEGAHICVGKNLCGRKGWVVCLKDGHKESALFTDKDREKASAFGHNEASSRGIPFIKR